VWMTSRNGEFFSQIIESLMISRAKSWIKFEGFILFR